MPESVRVPAPVSAISPARRRRLRRQSGENPERYLATLAMTALCTATLALWIGGHAELTVTGYHLGRVRTTLATVEQRNRVLAARAALLAQSARVIATAENSSMTRAVPAQTFYINEGSGTNTEGAIPAPKSINRPRATTIAMALPSRD